MTDLEKVFYNKYLRAVDKSSNLVSITYFTAQKTATKLKDLETSSSDKFLQSLPIDANGNVNFEKVSTFSLCLQMC